MEIVSFIEKGTPLTTGAVRFRKFKEKYENQNGGLLCEDVMKLIARFNSKCILVRSEQDSYKGSDYLVTDDNEHHTYYIHIDCKRSMFEKYDDWRFSQWSNNCTLYACVAACIRPYLSQKRTVEVLEKCTEEQWKCISAYYFKRGGEWFLDASE